LTDGSLGLDGSDVVIRNLKARLGTKPLAGTLSISPTEATR
jgi:hypothetical protein